MPARVPVRRDHAGGTPTVRKRDRHVRCRALRVRGRAQDHLLHQNTEYGLRSDTSRWSLRPLLAVSGCPSNKGDSCDSRYPRGFPLCTSRFFPNGRRKANLVESMAQDPPLRDDDVRVGTLDGGSDTSPAPTGGRRSPTGERPNATRGRQHSEMARGPSIYSASGPWSVGVAWLWVKRSGAKRERSREGWPSTSHSAT